MEAKSGTQLLPRTSALIALLTAEPIVDLTFRAGIVLAYGPCDHNAIGRCALCEGPCPSCSSPNVIPFRAVKFPLDQSRDYNDALHCGLCGAEAGHLEERAKLETGFYMDCIGIPRSVRFDGDGEL